MAARKDHFGCPGELFWLARGIVLGVEMKQLRTCLTYASSTHASSLFFARAHSKTLSLQLPMKFSNIVWVETSRYLIKITTLRKADLEDSYSQAYGFATITMYS